MALHGSFERLSAWSEAKKRIAEAVRTIKDHPAVDAAIETALSLVPSPFGTFLQNYYNEAKGSKEDKTGGILLMLGSLQKQNEKGFQEMSEEFQIQGNQIMRMLQDNQLTMPQLANKNAGDIKGMIEQLQAQIDRIEAGQQKVIALLEGKGVQTTLVQYATIHLEDMQKIKELENEIEVLSAQTNQKGDKDLEVKYDMMDANRHFYAGEYDKAQELYDAVLKLDRFNVEALTCMGHICLKKADFEAAEDYFKKALLIDSKNAFALVSEGQALEGRGLHISALNCLDQALGEKPDYPDALIGKGIILTHLAKEAEPATAKGFYSDAIKSFQKVLDSEPKNFYALFNKAVALDAQGLLDDAMSCIELTSFDDIPGVQALYQCGLMFERAREYEKALKYYDRILSIQADHVEANRKKGFALLTLGRMSEALPCYRKATETDPSQQPKLNLEVQYCVAVVTNDEEKLQTYAQGLGKSPNDPLATYLAARLEAILGKEPEALKELNAAFLLDSRLEKLALKDKYFEKLKISPSQDTPT